MKPVVLGASFPQKKFPSGAENGIITTDRMLGLELVVIIPQKFPGKLRAIEQEAAVFLHSQQSNNLSKVGRVIELITTELDDPTTKRKV